MRQPALLLLAMVALAAAVRADPAVYPKRSWKKLKSPAMSRWAVEKLDEARAFARTIDTAAVMVVQHGVVVTEWGDVAKPYKCHSMRKSLLSALYGIAVQRGRIKLDWTIGDLRIDDIPPVLTDTEKQATVRQLLQARSGVYHVAAAEPEQMKQERPDRGSHAPGTFWYYNNWDFNVLGTIFNLKMERDVFREFDERVAERIGMQDFGRGKHTHYSRESVSKHAAYGFELSTRDAARFGLLFARNGRWGKKAIVPEAWVRESTTSYSEAGVGGYGYMWWVAREGRLFPGCRVPDGSFTARGHHGHFVLVVPKLDLVVVHRVDTYEKGRDVSSDDQGRLVSLILAACPD